MCILVIIIYHRRGDHFDKLNEDILNCFLCVCMSDNDIIFYEQNRTSHRRNATSNRNSLFNNISKFLGILMANVGVCSDLKIEHCWKTIRFRCRKVL